MSKKILSRDSEHWLTCCWDECERPGYDSNRTLFHDHNPGMGCGHPLSKHLWYTFCTERHRQYFLNSHRSLGKLPAGYAKSII